ncbi:DUF4249 domain-containing protein [Pontibacter russatus]|uniref:DUF4249 domain-containing protein n=1 Tax=Pontibacter russatus TaxID=2694929 RepID=UPI00137AA529|nr:DUF4249 domain-containing protein [Pontibacter russatus]
MNIKHLFYALLPLAASLSGCDLDKDIDIDLPAHESQLVVEGYLRPGEPIRVAVHESSGYFDPAISPLVPDSKVFITHNGRRIELEYKPKMDELTRFIYTHSSSEEVEGVPGDVYTIEVSDDRGRMITGSTTLLPAVPIDTIEWRFNKAEGEEEEALLLTSFQDDASTDNYYRYMVHRDSLTNGSEQDISNIDNLTNGKRVTFGSGYMYDSGDTVIVTLYNMEKQYYDFLTSTSNARDANKNPFAQPSKIHSSVQGGLGIFTNLAYDRKVVVIE